MRSEGKINDQVEHLFPVMYDELHRIARRQLAPRASTFNTTALVHEAYLKLAHSECLRYPDRAHFFAITSRAMRQIVLNEARNGRRLKRGGDWKRVPLSDCLAEAGDEMATALDEALSRLGAVEKRLSRVVELRFFSGLNEKEIGQLLGISERTVRRDWRRARAFLSRFLEAELR